MLGMNKHGLLRADACSPIHVGPPADKLGESCGEFQPGRRNGHKMPEGFFASLKNMLFN